MTVGWQCTLTMLMSSMIRSREWLLLNAVESWLHHYEQTGNADTVALYKQMRDEFHDAYMATISKDVATPTTKSPRKRKSNDSQSSAEAV